MCHKTISLSLAGKSALSRHVEGEKHKQNMGKRKNFFKPQVGKIDAAKSTIDLVDIDMRRCIHTSFKRLNVVNQQGQASSPTNSLTGSTS